MRTAISVVYLLVLVASANASLVPWIGGPTAADVTGGAVLPVLTDPGEGNNLLGTYLSGTDITPGVWWQWSGGYNYFRMDLAATPTYSPLNYANQYGVFIDSGPGGATGADPYTPDMLNGIDYVLDMHFASSGNTWDQLHFHTWNGSGWTNAALYNAGNQGVEWDRSNGDKTLEWRVSDASFGTTFDFWGSSHETSDINHTYDITERGVTPEPGSLVLFGVGLLGAAIIRRRRSA